MEIKKNFYFDAVINGTELELAIRSDFKGDFTPEDYCIVQTRERTDRGTITRYSTMTRKELRTALQLPPKTKIELRY